MCTTAGMLLGEFLAGVLSEVMDTKLVIVIYMIINLMGVFFIIYRNRRFIMPIYNIFYTYVKE